MLNTGTVVIGTIGRDAHVVGAWILSYALEQAGFKVISLGSCVSQEQFVAAAVEANADAVFVSSLYGMGALDSEGLREKLIEAGIGKVLLYIGGMLAVNAENWADIEKQFKGMGFDRVYPPGTLPGTAIADLAKDLAGRT